MRYNIEEGFFVKYRKTYPWKSMLSSIILFSSLITFDSFVYKKGGIIDIDLNTDILNPSRIITQQNPNKLPPGVPQLPIGFFSVEFYGKCRGNNYNNGIFADSYMIAASTAGIVSGSVGLPICDPNEDHSPWPGPTLIPWQ